MLDEWKAHQGKDAKRLEFIDAIESYWTQVVSEELDVHDSETPSSSQQVQARMQTADDEMQVLRQREEWRHAIPTKAVTRGELEQKRNDLPGGRYSTNASREAALFLQQWRREIQQRNSKLQVDIDQLQLRVTQSAAADADAPLLAPVLVGSTFEELRLSELRWEQQSLVGRLKWIEEKQAEWKKQLADLLEIEQSDS